MVDGTAVLFAGIESTAETAGEESLFERVRRLTPVATPRLMFDVSCVMRYRGLLLDLLGRP